VVWSKISRVPLAGPPHALRRNAVTGSARGPRLSGDVDVAGLAVVCRGLPLTRRRGCEALASTADPTARQLPMPQRQRLTTSDLVGTFDLAEWTLTLPGECR
jgi:hypothetical protein